MDMKKLAFAAAISLMCGTAAQADPLSWTEIGVGYDRADSSFHTTDAFDIKGSIGFAGMGHAQLTYIDGSEGGSFGADFDGYEVRAGVHPTVGEKTQAVVEAIYFDYNADYDAGGGASEDGWGLGFGLRHQMSDRFEMRAQVDYFDGTWDLDNSSFSEDFNNVAFSIGGRYYWMPNLFTGIAVNVNGLEAASSAGTGGDVIRLDVGWSFGADVL